ncbi:MAG: IS66 family transposase, partial [Rhodoplanes sp.]
SGVPAKGDLARAIRYALKRWDAFTLFLEDGRVAIDNNPAERAIRPVATRRSLYPTSSSIWKHCKLVPQIDATRATGSLDRGDEPLVLKIGGADLVGSAGHDLLGGKDSILDEATNPVVGDAELRGGFGHCQPFAFLLRGTVGMDAVHPPQ